MIAVQDLRFAYRRGGEELFGGLNFVFDRGVMTVVTGASGSGKSTLLYLLGLLLTPSSGQVLYRGQPVGRLRDWTRSEIRASRIGFVFQDAALDQTRTVLDNVVEGGVFAGMKRRQARREALALMDRLDVQLRANHRPGEVSGGQAQRVGLCRALIKSPEILLADEPTGNLDSVAAGVVLGELESAASRGAIVVVASHDPVVRSRGGHVLSL
jgi:putative ABC transport system ATP-binding protein/lipoprotein-releasing system ATP-binding protein